MSVITPIGDVDVVSEADVRELAGCSGLCFSVFLPTHRAGPETRQDTVRFQNLLDRAAAGLSERGLSSW